MTVLQNNQVLPGSPSLSWPASSSSLDLVVTTAVLGFVCTTSVLSLVGPLAVFVLVGTTTILDLVYTKASVDPSGFSASCDAGGRWAEGEGGSNCLGEVGTWGTAVVCSRGRLGACVEGPAWTSAGLVSSDSSAVDCSWSNACPLLYTPSASAWACS